jgi:hypothetical protein
MGPRCKRRSLDDQLADPNRATVLAAGNGFGAHCHVEGALAKGTATTFPSESFAWFVPPDDPTLNLLDFWSNGDGLLWLYVTPPGGTERGPVTPTNSPFNLMIGSTKVGWVGLRSQGPGEQGQAHHDFTATGQCPAVGAREYVVNGRTFRHVEGATREPRRRARGISRLDRA